MGVDGLLPQLKQIQEIVSLQHYRGKTLAIDGYAWLHKSLMPCAHDLFYNRPTLGYLRYFQSKINMLKFHNIEPYFVFDGDDFGSKKATEIERSEKRNQNRLKSIEYERRGDTKKAYTHCLASIDVTPKMAKTIMDYLQTQNIKFIVAPYEADSQLVFLEKLKLVDGILSEDSDLLIFGCETLITKLDKFGGAIEIKRENFMENHKSPIGFMNNQQLRNVALLRGCDYTDGIKGFGMITALKKCKYTTSLEKIILGLRLDGYNISENLFEEMKRANLSFQFQRVFNPITKEIQTLNEIPKHELDNPLLYESIGDLLDNDIHHKIAIGHIDPITKQELISRENILKGIATIPQIIMTKPNINQLSTSKPINNEMGKKSPCLKRKSPSRITNIDEFFKLQRPISKTTNIKRSITDPDCTPIKTINNQLPTPLSSAKDLNDDFTLSPISKKIKSITSTPSLVSTTESKFFKDKKKKFDQNDNIVVEIVTNSNTQDNGDIENGSNNTNIELENTFDISLDSSIDNIDNPLLSEDKENILDGLDKSKKFHEMNSSEFEISDIDDDKDIFSEDDKIEEREREKESINKIKKGLFEKFGFKTTFDQSQIDDKNIKHKICRDPLKSIKHHENKPRLISKNPFALNKNNDIESKKNTTPLNLCDFAYGKITSGTK
ncbi:hypothetical protein WICMUC_001632 [Wickerhamomyces mucosus]|uniref:Exonuclease 1 n=1 Tax=Wickerhamomyces mucosus TaxID=1378264 RepID=A0A9P8PTR9_9ASCO|nr:hypothetical protein WICMUC_001632 [Wickerhamomyces mucosus]